MAAAATAGSRAAEASESEPSDLTVSELEASMDRILAWEVDSCGEKSVQDWLDGYACEHASDGNVESFVLGMEGCSSESWDFSSYENALVEELSEDYTSLNPTSLQKGILTATGLSSDEAQSSFEWEALISYAQNETIEAKGIMSFVYGLFVWKNTDSLDTVTDEILDYGLSYQCPDGGFALNGGSGDADVTAMTLQALELLTDWADASGNDSCGISDAGLQKAQAAEEEAFTFLEEIRCESGGFESSGTETSESSSQVALAYQAAGLDSSVFYPVLMSYLCEDGGVAHTLDGESNEMASAEAFYALSGIRRQLLDQGFVFDHTAFLSSDLAYGGDPDQLLKKAVSFKSLMTEDYRRPLSLGLILVWLVYAVLNLIGHKKTGNLRNKDSEDRENYGSRDRKKSRSGLLWRLAGASGICLLVLILVWTLHIQSREAYRSDESGILCQQAGPDTIEVSLSVSAETVGEGSFLPETTYYVTKGANVYELLSEVCRKENIQMEYTGSETGYIYIQGIHDLYELEHGELSGWMYRVNGEFPDKGCNSYILEDGDRVEWVYTTNIGKDVEDD